ncbi:Glycosyltransferase involved in cell wall bisynthesis [Kaistella treverensis]|uniref:Glycosyltransferase involved in cell wall bisynthesis n=1 Tax=Kaistella treverensis TaxID=631455 RepID=A0A1I3NJ42_9FLAO|nr:glycosyltransferase family 4 protein [Kaistella treverensis]SFJ09354.1 Glycosyltransferase involved in cell wall bisynthesis [Kaistella treverensis]
MKILYFTKYSRNAGSSRLRSYQYFPYLEEAGFRVEVSPLFSEAYLKQLYSGQSTAREALKGYVKRFFKLFAVLSYDRVVIEKELFPYLPAFAERILSLLGLQYVVDYDDAIFHNYDQNPNIVIRKILGNKIRKVMKYAKHVIAGNQYIADFAMISGAKNITIIHTNPNLKKYNFIALEKRGQDECVIGWIGNQSTYDRFVKPHRNLLLRIMEETKVNLCFIGCHDDSLEGERVRFVKWSEESEVSSLSKLDIGIMPIPDSPFERGKCSFKLLQYMACGLPVIASPVGMNTQVVENGVNGLLASSHDEWVAAIRHLADNPLVRKEMGKRGREYVTENFQLEKSFNKLLDVISAE